MSGELESSDAHPLPQAVTVDITYELDSKENTFRTQRVKDAYGIDFEVGDLSVIDDVSLTLEPGQILLATGASGAGKTSFCRNAAEQVGATRFEDIDLPTDDPLVDCFPDSLSVNETQRLMNCFGLGEAHLNLRTYDELSDGQRYRAKLAYATACYDVLFADEYCATLDRETAQVISYALRKQLLKGTFDTTYLFATTHRDMIDDLQPDWLLDFDANEVREREPSSLAEVRSGNSKTARESPEDVTQVAEIASQRSSDTTQYVSQFHSSLTSNLPPQPKRTGRISRGGIISGTRSDR